MKDKAAILGLLATALMGTMFAAEGPAPKGVPHLDYVFVIMMENHGFHQIVNKALDRQKYVWVRNKDRVDYGIPLPIKSGSSSQFFPDFLWWVKKTIWALDTTGKFILDEKIRTKLLTVPCTSAHWTRR